MNFTSSSYRVVAYWILLVVLLSGASAFTQSPQAEHHFPTQDNPRITISNASTISISPWEKSEVFVTAEVSRAPIQVDEVRIIPEKSKVGISCHPSKPDRNISLTLRVPAKTILEIRSQGDKVDIKQPVGQIIIIVSKESIQLNVPESASLDMQDAPNAVEHRQTGPTAFARIGIGNRRSGTSPPFVKVTAATAQVIVARGYIAPVTFAAAVTSITPVTKNPTLAATTIARRTSSMSRALRRSNPQLILPRRDQTLSANSTTDLEDGSLRLETHLINLNVSATDNAGKAIPDLKREDFSVYEDGVRQQISFFSPERSPFNLVLLIDLSGSMKDEIELIKATAIHFLDVIGPQDSVAVVTFTTDVTVVSHLTKDRDDLHESIDWMLAPAGGTAFYDALGYTLIEEFRKAKRERNAVIAITDGEDNSLEVKLVNSIRPGWVRIPGQTSGSFLTFEELLDGATESDALIYPIHLNPTPPQPMIIQPNAGPPPKSQSPILQVQSELTEIATNQLHALAEASGARFYHANRIADLNGVFEQVAAELRTIYSMAYTPTNLNYDGQFRKIKVLVNKPNVAIRTRPGYYGR